MKYLTKFLQSKSLDYFHGVLLQMTFYSDLMQTEWPSWSHLKGQIPCLACAKLANKADCDSKRS